MANFRRVISPSAPAAERAPRRLPARRSKSLLRQANTAAQCQPVRPRSGRAPDIARPASAYRPFSITGRRAVIVPVPPTRTDRWPT